MNKHHKDTQIFTQFENIQARAKEAVGKEEIHPMLRIELSDENPRYKADWDDLTRGPQMASPVHWAIFRYPIGDPRSRKGHNSVIQLPKGARVIRMDFVGQELQVWAMVYVNTKATEEFTFFCRPVPVLEHFSIKDFSSREHIVSFSHYEGFTWMFSYEKAQPNATDQTRYGAEFRAYKTGANIENPENLLYIGFYPLFIQVELGLYVFYDTTNEDKSS